MSKEKKIKANVVETEHASVVEAPVKEVATKEAKPAVPEIVYVTSKELAEKCGTKGTILRRWLRTLTQFQDSGYTRYKWEPNDPFLTEAPALFEKYQNADVEKKAARAVEAEAKAKAKAEAGENAEPKAPKAKKTKTAPEPAPVVEEDEDEDDFETEDDDEGEELE